MNRLSQYAVDLVAAAALAVGIWAGGATPQLSAPAHPAAGPQRSAVRPTSQRKIVDALQPFVDRHTLAGAVVLVASHEKVLSLQAVGYADLAANRPMRTDDLFWIASMTKPMTATAMMMLVDEGKVRLDDPVAKYLPMFAQQVGVAQRSESQGEGASTQPSRARAMTVRDLLSHTSGLPYMAPGEERVDVLSLEAAARNYVTTPLQYPPGQGWEYSNAGFNTAGRIIEVVAGMPYEQFMQQRLFTPLGMTDTTFWPSPAQVQRLAKCYHVTADKSALEEAPISLLTYPLTDPWRSPCPAGGLFSTASDVARFCRMIMAGGTLEGRRYLSLAAVQEMTKSLSNRPSATNGYGLGWGYNGVDRSKAPSARCSPFGHNGAARTHMWIDPDRDLITIFLVQQQGDYPGAPANDPDPAFQSAAMEAFGK